MVLGIYVSKPTEPEGKVVYVAINPSNHSTSVIIISYVIGYDNYATLRNLQARQNYLQDLVPNMSGENQRELSQLYCTMGIS